MCCDSIAINVYSSLVEREERKGERVFVVFYIIRRNAVFSYLYEIYDEFNKVYTTLSLFYLFVFFFVIFAF